MKYLWFLIKKDIGDIKFKYLSLYIVSFWIISFIYEFYFFGCIALFYKYISRIAESTFYTIPIIYAFSIILEYKTKTNYLSVSLPCRRFIPPLSKYCAYSLLLMLNGILNSLFFYIVGSRGSQEAAGLERALNSSGLGFVIAFTFLGLIGFLSLAVYHTGFKNRLVSGVLLIIFVKIFLGAVRNIIGIFDIPYLTTEAFLLVMGIFWAGIYLYLYDKWGYV